MKKSISNSRNYLLVLFSLLLCILFSEIILRLWFPYYHPDIHSAYKYDPITGYNLTPNIHYFETTDHQKEIIVNNFGTVNFQENFNCRDRLIFAIGDSYTQGAGVPSDASYPFQLGLYLNDNTASDSITYNVINLGVSGYGMLMSFERLLHYIDRIDTPSVILFLGAENDFKDDEDFSRGLRHKHLVKNSPAWGKILPFANFFFHHLQTGKRIKVLYNNLRSHKTNSPAGQINEQDIVSRNQIKKFLRLETLCRNINAPLIVSWAGNDESYYWLKDFANNHDIGFADWKGRVNKVKAKIPSLPVTNHHSGGHYRTWVNQMIAQAYMDEILKANIRFRNRCN